MQLYLESGETFGVDFCLIELKLGDDPLFPML